MTRGPTSRQRPGVTPSLRHARWTIVIAGVVALAAAVLVYFLLTSLLDISFGGAGDDPERRKVRVEAFKVVLGVAAGLGAVVALALNYRRHLIEESQSHRDDQRLFTDRFQTAAAQLGHDQPAVRLAGAHSMARLADDWDEQRQTCIDVLCAYLRLPATRRVAATGDVEEHPGGEIEVRQTIVRVITAHLRIDSAETTA